jgi:hypothetical protein
MAAQTNTALHALLGLVQWGDIGPLTTYRSRQGRLVIFQKTWPDKPATPPQIACRDSMTACGWAWRAMAPHLRQLWHQVARKCQCPGHGYNVWVHWRFKQRLTYIRTLEHQAGIQLSTNASCPNVYDPRWRDKPWRLGPTFRNPYIFLMPIAPSIDPFSPCTVWFMPFNVDNAYWMELYCQITLTGPGSIDTYPVHNRTLNRIVYTPAAPNTAARIDLVIDWPNGEWSEQRILLNIA